MDVSIRWKGFTRSHAVEEHLAKRLRSAIGRFAAHVTAVRVWLEDMNGPRGGVDKRCAIEVDGGLGLRRVEICDADLYAAVDRAAGRIGRSLGRAAGLRRVHA